eukprot:jgi/Astpho2/7320/Aster-01622
MPQTLTQPATQAPARPQPPVQLPVQHQPPVQPLAQPSAQNTVQRAAQPPRHQSELTALIPSWARLQQPVQQPPIDIEEAPSSDMVLPEEHERRKRSANVVMYGLSGESSACLKQAAEEVFQALNLPHAGQHVVAVEPLPTQGPHPPVVVPFDDPYWSTRLLRSKRGLRRLPALARVYIAEHLTRIQQAEKATRQPRFDAARQLGRAFWRGKHPALILLTETHDGQFDYRAPNLQGYDCISKPRSQAQQARRGPPRGGIAGFVADGIRQHVKEWKVADDGTYVILELAAGLLLPEERTAYLAVCYVPPKHGRNGNLETFADLQRDLAELPLDSPVLTAGDMNAHTAGLTDLYPAQDILSDEDSGSDDDTEPEDWPENFLTVPRRNMQPPNTNSNHWGEEFIQYLQATGQAILNGPGTR